jgi:flagellum-specific peptidoglycan hydrolase FlgJ
MNAKQYLWCISILRQAYKSKLLTNLPATAVAAQAVIESGYGKSEPYDKETGKRSFNLFGIKAYPDKGYIGTNGFVTCYTHEEINGEMELKLLHFRAYHNHKESFNDHARILSISKKNGEQRYRKAFDYLKDPEKFIEEVWKAGYATNSDYVENIIPIIRTLNHIPIWILKL